MKIIDAAQMEVENKKSTPVWGLFKSQVWTQKDLQAHETVISMLEKLLDNRYVVLRNVNLEGLDVPIPLVLVGPTCVRVLYANAIKGVFRAREDTWEQLDDRSQRFKPAQPNLITRAIRMARAVEQHISSQGEPLQVVEPVLVFADPGTHVDAVRPNTRIVLIDALERYVSSLVQNREILGPEDIEKFVAVLGGEAPPEAPKPSSVDERDIFSFQEEPDKKAGRLPAVSLPSPKEPSFLANIKFSSRQWKFLGAMLLINVIILVSFVVMLLVTT